MPFSYIRRAAVAFALLAAASCTVKSNQTPTLSGPSGLALSLNVNAIPDSISQDGGSQSSVKVTAIGPDGKGLAGLPLRMDMAANGAIADFGTLSARTIVTNADGVATVVYTAPPGPANGVFGTCNGLPGNCVSIVATPTATNFATANPELVTIRLVPTGVILPPAGLPAPNFTMSPTPALANVPVTFDASSSQPGSGATTITAYAWSFGDGTSGSGRTVTHTFTGQQTFNVTLTATNDRGLSASVTVATGVGGVAPATLKAVFSPAAPQAGQTVVFNADQSVASAGHSLTSFSWDFGDGGTASGSVATHVFANTGTYNVVLTALDDTGQRAGITLPVSVVGSGGSGGSATVASFSSSPSSPVVGQVVFFNAGASSAATGRTLSSYAWDFGDGTTLVAQTSSANHTFTNSGSFTVSLTVTDSAGTTAKTTNSVTVASAGTVAPTATFTFSPTAPGVNQDVFFNASQSKAGTGHTISTYKWDFGDGSTGSGVSPSHAYTRSGTFNVSLVVTDEAGQTGASSPTGVPVTAASSQIVAEFTVSPTSPGTAQTAFFDSTPSFSPSTITGYVWDFGDGTTCGTGLAACTGSNAKPQHAFAAPARTWIVRLTITDSASRTATTTHNVTTQ